jgi:hypothetical protein
LAPRPTWWTENSKKYFLKPAEEISTAIIVLNGEIYGHRSCKIFRATMSGVGPKDNGPPTVQQYLTTSSKN